jgi:hypothetical protein
MTEQGQRPQDVVELPGPDGQDIDLHTWLPTPADLGEPDTESAQHGDFHQRADPPPDAA